MNKKGIVRKVLSAILGLAVVIAILPQKETLAASDTEFLGVYDIHTLGGEVDLGLWLVLIAISALVAFVTTKKVKKANNKQSNQYKRN